MLCGPFSIQHYALCIALLLASCSDMFDTDSDRQIFDPALDQKTDSMFYTLGILKGLQQVADQYVLTGEMRGDLVATNHYTDSALQRLATFQADATNRYDSAYLYYRVINNCNYYVAHRDTTLLTGSRRVAIPEYAEALAVRAWAYLQLCRNYGEVPFYTDPIVSIGQANANIASRSLQAICDSLAPELMRYSGTAVPNYGSISAGVLNSSDSGSPTEKTVSSERAMIPVDVILGDLFLETHQYARAAEYYFRFLREQKWVIRQAYISPFNARILQALADKIPTSFNGFTINAAGAFAWENIFSVTGTSDIITYIPLAANQLRGVTTDLPRYFGYDFYSTTGGSSSSTARYLLERQIDPSAAYLALSDAQDYYFKPATGQADTVLTAELGDLRRRVALRQVSRDDSLFSVMLKFTSANVPIYRTATVYLRLAEAINRMGYPDAAFAILKDGINAALLTDNDYLRPATEIFLKTTVPFLSEENANIFTNNASVHSRGTYYTQGSKSPYRMDTIVSRKLRQLEQQFGFTATGTLADTINAVEDLICDELALELAFEGNRFGDLARLARHKNGAASPAAGQYHGSPAAYGTAFGTQWLARKLAYKAAGLEQRLQDEKNWFLPFN